jgi:hypothetical protein
MPDGSICNSLHVCMVGRFCGSTLGEVALAAPLMSLACSTTMWWGVGGWVECIIPIAMQILLRLFATSCLHVPVAFGGGRYCRSIWDF